MNSDVHWPFSLLIFVTSLVSTISTFLFYSILHVLNFHIFFHREFSYSLLFRVLYINYKNQVDVEVSTIKKAVFLQV